MDAKRWEQVKTILEEVRERPADERGPIWMLLAAARWSHVSTEPEHYEYRNAFASSS